MIACCYRSGQIKIVKESEGTPEGAISFATASRGIMEEALAGCARLAYDNETWLVPGIPEAVDDETAYQALLAFETRLQARCDELAKARRAKLSTLQACR